MLDGFGMAVRSCTAADRQALAGFAVRDFGSATTSAAFEGLWLQHGGIEGFDQFIGGSGYGVAQVSSGKVWYDRAGLNEHQKLAMLTHEFVGYSFSKTPCEKVCLPEKSTRFRSSFLKRMP